MSDELYCSWCDRSGHAAQPECRAGFPGQFPTADETVRRLRVAMAQAIDLLAERTNGHPARSAGHNARLCLEAALAWSPPMPPAQSGGEA